MENGKFYFKTSKVTFIENNTDAVEYNSGTWTNLSFSFNKQSNDWVLYVNGSAYGKGRQEIKLGRDLLELGCKDGSVEFTEFRLWRKDLPAEAIK